MKKRMQFLGATCAVILGAALAAAPGLAQQAATERSGEGGGVADNTATKSEAHFKDVDPGGEHASANRSRAGAASHLGVSTSHAGAAPAGAPGMMTPHADTGANTDLGPIRLEGFTGLQRRANRKALIANAPTVPGRPPVAIGIGAPFMFSGANGKAHNTGSVVAPGASSSAVGTPSLGRNAADLRTSAPTGANAVGSVATAATGAALHHPSLPSSAITGVPSHAAVISGTTVSHIASGPGYLGGPAKDRSGINGTAIRPKY